MRNVLYGRAMDPCYNSALYSSLAELLHGDAALIDEPAAVWRSARADDLRALAKQWLVTDGRAVVELALA